MATSAAAALWLAPAVMGAALPMFLPLGLAMALDRQPGRPLTWGVALCGLAAGAAPLQQAIASDAGLLVGVALGGRLSALLPCWLAQGSAWLVGETLPLLLGALSRADCARKIRRLRAERELIAQEWL